MTDKYRCGHPIDPSKNVSDNELSELREHACYKCGKQTARRKAVEAMERYRMKVAETEKKFNDERKKKGRAMEWEMLEREAELEQLKEERLSQVAEAWSAFEEFWEARQVLGEGDE